MLGKVRYSNLLMVPHTHFVPPDDPNNQHTGEGIKNHERGVDGPFLLDKPSVHNRKARDGLQADQAGRCQLPGIITRNVPRGEPKRVGRHRLRLERVVTVELVSVEQMQ